MTSGSPQPTRRFSWARITKQPRGAYIVVLALLLAVFTVYVGTRNPPNLLAASILQAVAFVLGIWGSYLFSKETSNPVVPAIAEAAERNLRAVAIGAHTAKLAAQNALERETGAALKQTVGVISVHLSYIEDLTLNEIQTWHSILPQSPPSAPSGAP